MSVPLKALPLGERPRERLLRLGAEKLSDVELLAILLNTGCKGRSVVELAQELLHYCEQKAPGEALRYLLHLRDTDLRELMPGLGTAKVCRILAALQIGQRFSRKPLRKVDVSNPRDVYEYLSPRMEHLKHEQFQVILLNAKNQVIDVESISEGTLTSSLVHPREVFKPAIRRSAFAILLAHNHPSGDPTPSREDLHITERLVEAGELIGIRIIDHVIIGHGRYVSLRRNGILK